MTFWHYLGGHKKFWLAPFLLVLAVYGLLILVGSFAPPR